MIDSRAALLDHVRHTLVDSYTVERELDEGATAHVFVAFDRRHERPVAIKVLKPELARTVGAERFLREVRTAAQLQHPHIVPVFDSGVSDALYYYVMPLVDGESLQRRLRREKQLPLKDALHIAREIADALAHAHARGLVHRDVKPANILISGEHVAVTDFGIARALSQPDDVRLTGVGLSVGTPAYMSPEQASGERSLDGRSDVYALGCVLYEMLVGMPPFEGSDAQVVLSQHRHDAPQPISIVRPEIPEPVDAVVRRMLAKVPADRLASAEVARDQIDELLLALATNELKGRRLTPAPERVGWRRPIGVLIASGVLVAAWILVTRARSPELDPNRILVFPLEDIGGGDAASDGLAVATYIGYALDGTRPLRWVEAHPLLAEATSRTGVTQEQATALARTIGAGHFVDGAIVRSPDSVAVILRLHSVVGDSLVRREGVAGPPGTNLPQLGLRAVAALVPLLIEPGRRTDFSALRDRSAPAVAKFLQGERAYRASHFADALTLYDDAVQLDSAFALAAIKGALAARALDRDSSARELYAVAVRQVATLPPRQAGYTAGLGHYLSGDADSALARFKEVLASDSTLADVWLAMAETYHHLLPNVLDADSLAANAYSAALQRDSTLLLARVHLAERDVQEGRLASSYVRDALAADTVGVDRVVTPLRWAVACAAQQRPDTFWSSRVVSNPRSVLDAGKLLAVHGAHAPCARSAFWSLLHAESADIETRWGSLLTLHGLLVATHDTMSLPAVYKAGAAASLPIWPLRLMAAAAAAAGADEPRIADSIAISRGTDFREMNSATLWLRATWAARRDDRIAARDIAGELLARARATPSPQDSTLAASASALAALASRDTTSSIAQLLRLRPHAPRADVTWQPFAAHGLERLTLAQLLLSKGRSAEAAQVASLLEATEPVTYLLYYRQGLALRLRAERKLGNSVEANNLAARLERLRPGGAALRTAG